MPSPIPPSPVPPQSTTVPSPQPGKWWKSKREEVTTSGSSQKSVAEFWEGAAGKGLAVGSRAEQSTAKASNVTLANNEESKGRFEVKHSSYVESYSAGHRKVGRRGVAMSPEAAAAREEAVAAATSNRAAGARAHIHLNHFDE